MPAAFMSGQMPRPRLREATTLDRLLRKQYAGVADFNEWMDRLGPKAEEQANGFGVSIQPTLPQLVDMMVGDVDLYRDLVQGVRKRLGERRHAVVIKQATPAKARTSSGHDYLLYTLAHRQLRLLVTPRNPPMASDSSLQVGPKLATYLWTVVRNISAYMDAGEISGNSKRTQVFMKLCSLARQEIEPEYPGAQAPKQVLVRYEEAAIGKLNSYESLAKRHCGVNTAFNLATLI
jgi:hypothetical protein